MKKAYFFVAMLLCNAGVWGQATGDYRSAATGNWNANATWERFDGISWVAAVATPTSADGAITIRSPHVVTISAAGLSYDQVTVDLGAQVTVAATITSTLSNGTATDLTINGTWLNSGGTWTMGSSPAWQVSSGGTYIHNTTSGIATPLGSATFDAASNFIYRGSSTLTPAISTSGRTYGNLTFESTSGSYSVGPNGGGTLTVNGNFTIGSGVTLTTTQTGVMTFAGNFTQNGTLTNSTGTQVYTFTGSNKTISGSGTISFETLNINSGASITANSAVTVASTFTATVTGTLATAAGLTNNGTFNVNGTFKLNQGGSLSGTSAVYGVVSTLIYAGTSAQTVTATEFPAASGPNSLTINNSVEVMFPGSFARTIPGNLTLTNGKLVLGDNNLTVGGNINDGSATSYIKTNGTGKVTLNNISEALLPVGNAAYNPVTIENGSGHNWIVSVEDGVVADPGHPADKAVLVTWNITPSVNPPNAAADITFQFDETSQVGPNFTTAENVQAWHRTTHWQPAGTDGAVFGLPGEKKFKATGLTRFSPYALSNISGPLPISINYFNGIKQINNHLLNWKVTCNSSARVTMTVERSADSRNFTGITTITADAVRCNQPFEYTDTQPLKGMNYYRLRTVDDNAKISNSGIVALLNAIKGFEIISIAPNPVITNNFKLNVTSVEASTMTVVITDMQGRVVDRQNIPVIAGFSSIPVNAAKLGAGTYSLQASIADERSKLVRFIKQ